MVGALGVRGAAMPLPKQKAHVSAQVEIVFSTREQRIIQGYFQPSTSNLPPGLAKRGGNLPPGLEKHLQRNGTLPPGLQKRVQPFPVELERRLPRLPGGYVRVILEGRAVILGPRNTIVDVMVLGGGGRRHEHGRGHEDEDENENED
jgi:hypothetical protein